MNRRSFLRTATLSTAAVTTLCGQINSTPVNPIAIPTHPPFDADIADPSAKAQGANHSVDLFARMEERHPADPGELSGAVLRIMGAGEWIAVCATIGDVMQSDGCRAGHLMGWLDAATTARMASIDPTTIDEEVSFLLSNPIDQADCYGVWLTLVAGENPELRLDLSNHCFGVLRGIC